MVKQGYKETEIGIIPAEWELCTIERNFDYFPNNTYARDHMNDISGFVHNIHYGDVLIKYGFVLDCDNEKIPFINSSISVNITKRLIQSGDVIMADTAEDETVGKAIEVANVGNKRIVSGLHTYLLRAHADLFAPGYLGYFINSAVYHNQLLSHIVGTKVSSISKKGLNETIVLRPSILEQRRIAEVLTDVDSLIESLEKLVAKKKTIKQGAMQELLTGKKRLPGFTGEWVEKKLDALLSSAKSGGTPLTSVSSYYNGNIPFLSINDMTTQGKYLRYASNNVSKEGVDNSSSFVVPIDSLIYSMYASVGFVSIAKIPLAISQAVLCLIVNNNCDTEFLYYVLCHIKPMIFKYVGEGTQKNLTAKAVKSFKLVIPKYKVEQIAIANVLSDMDSEIVELEKKLSKYRNVKTGMMQTLLTGKIRLPKEMVNEHVATIKQEED